MLARVCAAAVMACVCSRPALAERPRPVPLYTNEDLDRVRPLRDETGVASEPAVVPPAASPARATAAPRGHDEAYWRREVERLQDRLAPLSEKAHRLQAKIEERRRLPGVRPYTDPQLLAWQADLQRIQECMRELEEKLQDRARREGALPGWLR
jgi:hypothetical protein